MGIVQFLVTGVRCFCGNPLQINDFPFNVLYMELKQRQFKVAQAILLDIAQERTLEGVFSTVVEGNARKPRHTFTGIWLLGAGDACLSCAMRSVCADQTKCLHLVASAGHTKDSLASIQSAFHRIPIGAGEIGRIASTGKPFLVSDLRVSQAQSSDADWVKREGIKSFNGQPIIYKGELVGVLALYNRHTIEVDKASMWWRMIADHVAAAIVNARAFEEIEQLKTRLEIENAYLREEVNEFKAFGEIVGESPALKNVIRQIELVAPTDASVLILGESGTGKELVAREIHKRSLRSERPLIRVNCASIPHELYESEFFGHARGSFTGAVRDRMGRFEAADGGTLFLDEVGEIPLELQGKLLRALQEQQFERLGEDKSRQVNVRFIAATNRNLMRDVEAGKFREDLYYRLNVFPIEVAPLRRRLEDIPLLAAHLLKQSAKKLNCNVCGLTRSDVLKLQSYRWPGNVRELQNVIDRAVISARNGPLEFDLPDTKRTSRASKHLDVRASARVESEVLPDHEIKRREQDNILAALQRSNGKIYGPGGAAELLKLKPTTLATRIKAMRLNVSELRRQEANQFTIANGV